MPIIPINSLCLDNVFGVIEKQQGSDKSLATQSVKRARRANSNIANELPPHPRDSKRAVRPLVGTHPPVFVVRGHRLGVPGVGLSPASPLERGLELRRRQVPRAVAPVAEDGAQGPEQPDIGLRIDDAGHCPYVQESRPTRLLVGPCRPNHSQEEPFLVLPGQQTPRGCFRFPPVPPEEHGIEGPFP